jgi:glycosyltransferase involved in cell wall biosynthesis
VVRSVSVLLPVKDAQYTLAPTVHKILDVVSEISRQVELLIIDDGSTDATSEIAVELTRHYPQVQAICQGRSLGREAAIRSALQKTTGEIALIHEENQGRPLDEVVKALKLPAHSSQFYFRLDTAKSPQIKPIQDPGSASDPDVSVRGHERQTSISSRPTRPNFLERMKNLVLGE